MSAQEQREEMTPERFARIREIFTTAARLTGGAQDTFISQACNDDPILESEVRELLTLGEPDDEQVNALIAEAAQGLADTLDEKSGVESIGPYRIHSLLGRGGMGSVWLAERADGQFEQKVAIKFVGQGRATAELVNRFRSERQILAGLDHPGIARLIDGGETDDGVPYIVMEYVDGIPVDRYCDEHKLSIRERLALFVDICAVIEYAHRNLIVHRDIKASNVLVTAEGEPKLLDFGIAKLLDLERARTLDMHLTSDANRLLTPATASPEQLQGKPVTTASDVYALGHLLYCLLTGAMPYDVDSADRFSLPRAILDDDPVRPSIAIKTASAASRNTTPERLSRQLSGDIDAIVLKALRKQPEDRYAAPRELAEDVQRHLENRPVQARGEAFGYVARRFISRNRGGLAVAGSMLLLIASLVTFYTSELASERDRARVEAQRAEEVATFLTDLFEVSTPDESRGAQITAREMLDRGAERIGAELDNAPVVQVSLMHVIGMAYGKLGLYTAAAEILERALARRESLGIPDDAVMGTTLHNLGVVYLNQARFEEAVPLLNRALDLRRELLGPAHTDIAATLRALSSLEYDLGNYEKASTYVDEAEAMVRAMEPAEPLALAHVLIVRGDLANQLGNYDAAVESYRDAVALHSEFAGNDHPDTLVGQNNLADALIGAGRYAEAEAILRELLEVRRRVLPAGHTDIATTLGNLASSIKQQHRPAEALPIQEEALAIHRAQHAGDHPELATVLNNIANLHHDLRDLDRAQQLHEESLAMKLRMFGEDHPSLADSYVNLASVKADRDDFAGALALYRQTLELDAKTLGEDHPYVHADRIGIGAMQGLLGQTGDAETTLRRALADSTRVLGAEHPQTFNAMRELGIVLVLQQRCDAAEPYLAEGLVGLERVYPDNPWEVALARAYLGACRALNDPAVGEQLMRQGYDRLVALRGYDDRLTRQALERLTQFLRSNGRDLEAQNLEGAAASGL